MSLKWILKVFLVDAVLHKVCEGTHKSFYSNIEINENMALSSLHSREENVLGGTWSSDLIKGATWPENLRTHDLETRKLCKRSPTTGLFMWDVVSAEFTKLSLLVWTLCVWIM